MRFGGLVRHDPVNLSKGRAKHFSRARPLSDGLKPGIYAQTPGLRKLVRCKGVAINVVIRRFGAQIRDSGALRYGLRRVERPLRLLGRLQSCGPKFAFPGRPPICGERPQLPAYRPFRDNGVAHYQFVHDKDMQ
jgi:hypothetical protein